MPNTPLGPRPGGNASKLNISSALVVKAEPGTLYRISVDTASGASISTCYDANTVANAALGVTAANLICEIPVAGTGILELDWPCKVGITVVPGSGANLSVSYE